MICFSFVNVRFGSLAASQPYSSSVAASGVKQTLRLQGSSGWIRPEADLSRSGDQTPHFAGHLLNSVISSDGLSASRKSMFEKTEAKKRERV